LYDSPLIITERPQTASEQENRSSGADIQLWLSPLLHAELENFHRRPRSPETEKLQELVGLLLNLYASCGRDGSPQGRSTYEGNPKHKEATEKFIAHIRSWQQDYRNEWGTTDALLLAQAFSNTFLIFYHLVRFMTTRNNPFTDQGHGPTAHTPLSRYMGDRIVTAKTSNSSMSCTEEFH